MTKRLKERKDRNIIILDGEKQESYIHFCFAEVTSNKDYNFNYFAKNKSKELEARKSLDELIDYLSREKWHNVIALRKETKFGYETLHARKVAESIWKGKITPDGTVSVIRFHKQEYRLIGIYKESVFYVFGYDFEHNAYDH